MINGQENFFPRQINHQLAWHESTGRRGRQRVTSEEHGKQQHMLEWSLENFPLHAQTQRKHANMMGSEHSA